jgi:hypothetical protein
MVFNIEQHLDRVVFTLSRIRRDICEEPVRFFQDEGLAQ